MSGGIRDEDLTGLHLDKHEHEIFEDSIRCDDFLGEEITGPKR